MRRYSSLILGILLAVFLLASPIAYAYYRHSHFRNFRVVTPGVLYRSGQLSLSALKCVIHDQGIRTVVSLRGSPNSADLPPDWAEERYCEAQEISFVRIAPRTWWAPDGSIPAEVGVSRFREVMDDPANYPVLVHCYAGIHRSGAYSAVFRMEYEGWSNSEAIAEMRALGYRDLDDEWDLLTYLRQYRRSRQ